MLEDTNVAQLSYRRRRFGADRMTCISVSEKSRCFFYLLCTSFLFVTPSHPASGFIGFANICPRTVRPTVPPNSFPSGTFPYVFHARGRGHPPICVLSETTLIVFQFRYIIIEAAGLSIVMTYGAFTGRFGERSAAFTTNSIGI